MGEGLETKISTEDNEEIDPIQGLEGIEEKEETKIISEDTGTVILNKLKKIMRLSDNQWTNLAMDLIIGKLIMDYKYLVYVKYEDQTKGKKQSLKQVYEIGRLINDFVALRQLDLRKDNFRRDNIGEFPISKVIGFLIELIDYAAKNKDVKFNRTSLRNFASIAERFHPEELDPEIPGYIYKEVVERVPQDMFSDNRLRRKFQNDILKLRKQMIFTDRHLRIAIALVREDVEKRANITFLKKVLEKIQTLPNKISFKKGFELAKPMIDNM